MVTIATKFQIPEDFRLHTLQPILQKQEPNLNFMKRILVILILIGHFLNADATNYFVSNISGNDINSGLSIGTAFKTIQKAADLTWPGDTVFVLNL